MKNKTLCLLFLLIFLSCKKKESTKNLPNQLNAVFNFQAYDVYGHLVSSNALSSGNLFIIDFTQNNQLIYSVKTSNFYFTVNNFKDGAYVYQIRDSLKQYGYVKDSIISKNGSVYLGRSKSNITPWLADGTANLTLGGVQIKPTFGFNGYTAKDSLGSLFVTVNASGSNVSGGLIFYYYKNRSVSSSNLTHYGPFYDATFIVSQTNTVFSSFIYESDLEDRASFLPIGDSLYFAVYPAGNNPQSFDFLAPKDTLGNFQMTAVGSQKIIIPYKWQ